MLMVAKSIDIRENARNINQNKNEWKLMKVQLTKAHISNSTKKIRQYPQNSIYSAEQSAIINAI
jgi:hypothetical protein